MMMSLFLSLFLGCSGDKTLDATDGDGGHDDGGHDDGGDDDSGDTAGSGWVATYFTVQAVFGLDREAGTLRAFTIDAGTVLPVISIVLMDETVTPRCSVDMLIEDPEAVAVESWVWVDEMPETGGEEMQHLGFMVPDDATISHDCDDWDPGPYGELLDLIPPHEWGIGVGTLRTDIAATVAGADFAGSFHQERLSADELFGGSWAADLWTPPTYASHAAAGSPAPDWHLEVDGEGYALDWYDETDWLAAGDQPPSGVWQVVPVLVWSMESWFGD